MSIILTVLVTYTYHEEISKDERTMTIDSIWGGYRCDEEPRVEMELELGIKT
jgi:hypothetical protein